LRKFIAAAVRKERLRGLPVTGTGLRRAGYLGKLAATGRHTPPMKTRRLPAFAAVAAVSWLAGCTLPHSGSHVSSSQVGQLQKLTVATVIKTKDITIDGTRGNMGQYSGAILGGAAALPRGGVSSTGQALGVAGASVVGALAGQTIEEYITRKKAQEITIQMSNGDVHVITQESPPNFQIGDKVSVISGPTGARLELALEF